MLTAEATVCCPLGCWLGRCVSFCAFWVAWGNAASAEPSHQPGSLPTACCCRDRMTLKLAWLVCALQKQMHRKLCTGWTCLFPCQASCSLRTTFPARSQMQRDHGSARPQPASMMLALQITSDAACTHHLGFRLLLIWVHGHSQHFIFPAVQSASGVAGIKSGAQALQWAAD